MRVRSLGESCLLVDRLPIRMPARLAQRLNRDLWDGIEEVVAAYDTLAVYGDPHAGWEAWLESHIEPLLEDASIVPTRHRIPICYSMGMDLDSTAELLCLTDTELIELHSEPVYLCYAVGFSPGFAYLGYLADRIATAPRHIEPRTAVPKGSLGIAERQTAVYPSPTPGGWRLIGRCPLELVDERTNYFPIEPGDEVQFVPISPTEYFALEGKRL